MEIDVELLEEIKEKIEGVLYGDEEFLSTQDLKQIINAIDDILIMAEE